MSEDEYLMSSRQRRANAGSRLKQLIDMESESVQPAVSSFVDEDDENVNLLFQEDEDDQEFMESESEDEEEGEEEEGEGGEEVDGEDQDGTEQALETEGDQPNSIQNELEELEESDAQPVDSDDVLSDSDISLSGSDEDEGERELESEERRKKRKQKSQSRLVPKIKRFKVADSKKPKQAKPKKVITSESLLHDTRRSSTRASAIESKEALVKRLKMDEKRRASTTPIVREKQVDLTQEEKLLEAIETEKANILSLELFQKQEIVKKERQKHLLQSRKPKMVDIISFTSKEQYISPTEEVENAIKLYKMITGKSRKRHIKKLKELFEIDLDKYPGEIDKDLPYYKEEQRLKTTGNGESQEVEDAGNVKAESDIKSTSKEDEVVDKTEDVKAKVEEQSKENEIGQNVTKNTGTEKDKETKSVGDNADTAENDVNSQEEVKQTEPSIGPKDNDVKNGISSSGEVSEAKEIAEAEQTGQKAEADSEEPETHATPKNVTFAEDVKDNNSDAGETSREPSKEPEESVKEDSEPQREIFEGPIQRVVRNFVTLLNFDESRLQDETEVKKIVFGEQSLLPAPRRFKDMKTILKIGNVNNPYAKVRVEKDEAFLPADDLTIDDPMFEELNRLPKLGIRQAVVEEVVEEDTNDAAIELTTEAPIGIYLPNGNKKLCLITGSEVKYFDPSLGVPYSDVETFKFLKSIEQGNIPWYSFDASYNDTGATEIYLGSRDGSTRSARGVPEGFDA